MVSLPFSVMKQSLHNSVNSGMCGYSSFFIFSTCFSLHSFTSSSLVNNEFKDKIQVVFSTLIHMYSHEPGNSIKIRTGLPFASWYFLLRSNRSLLPSSLTRFFDIFVVTEDFCSISQCFALFLFLHFSVILGLGHLKFEHTR